MTATIQEWLERHADPAFRIDRPRAGILRERDLRGRRVPNLRDLSTPRDYTIVRGSDGSIAFAVRRERRIEAAQIKSSSFQYSITIVSNSVGRYAGVRFYLSSLESVLRQLLYCLMEQFNESFEIQILATSNHARGSYTDDIDAASGLYVLNRTNIEALIGELLWALTLYSQSANRELSLAQLAFTFVTVKRHLDGDAIRWLPLKSMYGTKKRYNPIYPGRGSVLYVESESHCFWVSLYFTLISNKFNDKLVRPGITDNEKRRTREMFAEMLKTPTPVQDASNYFERRGIDIQAPSHPVGSPELLSDLSQKLNSQISIVDESGGFKRALRIPLSLDMSLDQIALLRVENIGKDDKGKLRSYPHYHGLVCETRFLSSINQLQCIICGVHVTHRSLKTHECDYENSPYHQQTGEELTYMCTTCHRPEMKSELAQYLGSNQFNKVCHKPSIEARKKSRCKNCSKTANNPLCDLIHRSTCFGRGRKCVKCHRYVHLRGRYKKHPRSEDFEHHLSCDLERWCQICQDYVIDRGLTPDSSSHQCYIQPLLSSAGVSNIGALDLECARGPDGVFRPVCGSLVYSPFKDDLTSVSLRVFSEAARPGDTFLGKAYGEAIDMTHVLESGDFFDPLELTPRNGGEDPEKTKKGLHVAQDLKDWPENNHDLPQYIQDWLQNGTVPVHEEPAYTPNLLSAHDENDYNDHDSEEEFDTSGRLQIRNPEQPFFDQMKALEEGAPLYLPESYQK